MKAMQVLAALVTVGLFSAACAAPTSQVIEKVVEKTVVTTAVPGPAKISMWFHSGQGGERDVIVQQVEAFNKSQTEYAINPVQLPEGSYNTQVNAGALIGQLPCVLDFDGPNLYNYAWKGYLTPLDDLIPNDIKSDMLPSIIAQGTYGGKLYSLGTFDSGLGLWGNKSMLQKAGVRIPKGIEDPWTLQEFEAALESLKKLDNIKYPLDVRMSYARGEWYTYGLSAILQGLGGDLIDRKDYQKASGVLDGPASVAAMKTFKSWIDKGYINPNETKADTFAQKNTALQYVGHWYYATNKKGLGDDLVLIPMPKFGDKVVVGMGSWNWGITKDCASPQGAAEFLKFILQPDEVLRMTDANGAVPGRKAALAKSKLYGSGGELSIYAQQLNAGYGLPRPVTPAYPAITTAFTTAVDNISKGADVQEELTKAAKAIDKDIADNKGYPLPK